jgi:hypothetical protein
VTNDQYWLKEEQFQDGTRLANLLENFTIYHALTSISDDYLYIRCKNKSSLLTSVKREIVHLDVMKSSTK